MKKIRIGTDVRIKLALKELSDYDQTAIKQLKCYVIRTSDLKYINLNRHGYPQFYYPTEYTTWMSGFPLYFQMPYNAEVFNSGMFGVIDDYRLFPSYNGFGVYSRKFKCIPKEYLAPSRVLEQKNAIELYFPGVDQINIGTYKVVVVVTVYQPGWGYNNLRTYAFDQGELFELVNDNTGESGDISIGVEPEQPKNEPQLLQAPSDLYIDSDINTPTLFVFGDKDQHGVKFEILVKSVDGTIRQMNVFDIKYIPITCDDPDISIETSQIAIRIKENTATKIVKLVVGKGDSKKIINLHITRP